MNAHEELKRYQKAAALVRVLNRYGATAESAANQSPEFWAAVALEAKVAPPRSVECVELVVSLLPPGMKAAR